MAPQHLQTLSSGASALLLRAGSRASVRPAAVVRSRVASPLNAARPRSSLSHAGNVRFRLLRSQQPRGFLSGGGVRWSSESATGSKIWSFEEIQNRPATVTLIDVREPGEIASTGKIPGAVNIPITTSPDSFHISAEEFEDRFGFERPAAPGPDSENEVVFYCKAGVRSRAAAGIAREAGWKKVGEYPGSWVEWSGKGGKIER